MALSQVLQLLQNRVHPRDRGGVPITPTMKTFNRPATMVEDVESYPISIESMGVTEPVQPSIPRVVRQAPTLDNSGSQELMRQAQAILAGLGNDARPQIQAPNNESIALALLPALLGAGTRYLGGLGQGYMAGQNQELALIEQERRRREQNIVRQAQGLQSQANTLATRENQLFGQENQNFRNDENNARMRELAGLGAETRKEIADAGNQTRMGIAEGQQAIQQAKVDLDRERVEVGNAAKLWAMALKEANMDGQVTAADVARLESLRKDIGGEKYASRLVIPPIGSSWAKIKNDADMVYKQLVLTETQRRNRANEAVAGQRAATSQQNADTSRARLEGKIGGGSSNSDAMPGDIPTVSRKEAGRYVTNANGSIKQLRAKQKLEGDQKKKAQLEIQIQGLAAKRDYYQTILDGGMPPMDPGAPPKKVPFIGPVKPQSPGVGIPAATSFGEGGDKTQRTQAELDKDGMVKTEKSRFKKRS